MHNTLPSLDGLKDQARRLRTSLERDGQTVSHSKALELLAAQYGYKDWNTLHAATGNRPPAPRLNLGQRTRGRYLGQPFEGEVIRVSKIGDSDFFHVTLKFDEPVDVVTFESFSAFRSQVSCTVNRDGRTVEKTSNGTPHMVLDL